MCFNKVLINKKYINALIKKKSMSDIKTDVEQNFVTFLREAKELGKNLPIEEYDKVIIAGMGGSGISGDLLQIMFPNIITIHNYSLPENVNNKTLVIVCSYSGNTEEMIALYNEARKKICQVIVITSGGRLKEKSIKDKVPYVKIPSFIQPRASIPYMLLPLMNVLQYEIPDVSKLIETLRSQKIRNKAKELAEKLVDKIPIIYSSKKIYAVAYRWKTQFNENTKIHAFSNAFPELNHNEIEAYENLVGDYHIILLVDEADSLRIKKRMEVMKKLIMEKGVSVTEIAITGKNLFSRIITEFYLGDLTSIYLAEKYEIDPTPVELIEKFKKQLK